MARTRPVRDALRRLGRRLFPPADPHALAALDGGPGPEPGDVARCRVCGCTDERACPGGCWWVPDPEMLAGDDQIADGYRAGSYAVLDPLTATDPSGHDTRAEARGER